ncbi:hypothetical protein BKA81DRAFT_150568 [Phyllosticta paracitricarpa]|uniref:Uncharacterized protein n=2 Tax=Phyllosticta TaxID=121621 RepID=A0ABR1LNW5_9PEZI
MAITCPPAGPRVRTSVCLQPSRSPGTCAACCTLRPACCPPGRLTACARLVCLLVPFHMSNVFLLLLQQQHKQLRACICQTVRQTTVPTDVRAPRRRCSQHLLHPSSCPIHPHMPLSHRAQGRGTFFSSQPASHHDATRRFLVKYMPCLLPVVHYPLARSLRPQPSISPSAHTHARPPCALH